MSNEIQDLLIPLAKHEDLSFEQAQRAFQIILSGGATPPQMAAFLMGLRQKGESETEILAGATVLRAKATTFSAPAGSLDTCGTGGDAKGTLNVSTATAIIVAACGVPVVKHGNKSITSLSGSSDVLRALIVNLNAPMEKLERGFKETNLVFLAAPLFHPGMRHIAPVRQELGLRTIFNLLGPLANPAKPDFQLLGVFAPEWLDVMANVLKALGTKAAWVVYGAGGTDELSLAGENQVTALKNGIIEQIIVKPEDAGLEQEPLEAIQGGDAPKNAEAIMHLLRGAKNAYREAALFNSAACLLIADKANDLKEGVAMARDAIDSGKARETLAALIALTGETHA